MSLMEKRIETDFPVSILINHGENEWALWKKGLRRAHLIYQLPLLEWTNEWALWKKGLRRQHRKLYLFDRKKRMNEPYGKKDWDASEWGYPERRWLGNEWALWKKGLRPMSGWCFLQRVFHLEWMSLMEKRIETGQEIMCYVFVSVTRMNEPYGKKDWDHCHNLPN